MELEGYGEGVSRLQTTLQNGSSPRRPRHGPLQGCYAQRPDNSLWPAAPASLGHFVQRWSGRETQTGQQEKPLQRKVPGWQLRKETTKMTLKEDNQQSVTVKGLYQPAQKCGTQLRSNTATDAPVQRPSGPQICFCMSIEHPSAAVPFLSHGRLCKHGKTLDAMLSQWHV